MIEQRFAIGAVDPMVDQVKQSAGGNLDLPLAVSGNNSDEVLGPFGSTIELVPEPSWPTKVPYRPSCAGAVGGQGVDGVLLDRPEPVSAALALAQQVHALGGRR